MTWAGLPHQYKLLLVAKDWASQEAECKQAAPSAYLAIPDDPIELLALDTFPRPTADYWVGITDAATEGTWLNALSMPQTFLPWDAGQPGAAAGTEDCVKAPARRTIDDVSCEINLPAICECEP